jgi:hypothetical protein
VPEATRTAAATAAHAQVGLPTESVPQINTAWGTLVSTVMQPASHIADEDLQEYRAYLQRGETRLSTLHRVAGSFISGAGLLTLLPVLISNVFGALLAGVVFRAGQGIPEAASVGRWLVLAPVVASIGLPLAALYLLIRELTQFYFTARPFKAQTVGRSYPRFILSGLMVSNNSLRNNALINNARNEPYVTDLLVPSTDSLRRKLLAEAHAIDELRTLRPGDDELLVREELRDFLFSQTASDVRTLPQESAKMEASIARHQRSLRGLVLRYSKAFLLTIVTTLATIAAVGALSLLQPTPGITNVRPEYVWLATMAIYAVWCVLAVVVVRRPVSWVYRDISDQTNKRTPQSLQYFERATLGVVTVAVLLNAAACLIYAGDATPGLRSWAIITVILSVGGVSIAVASVLISEFRRNGPPQS